MSEELRQAAQVKKQYEKTWMSIEGIVAVGLGSIEGKPGIVISVNDDPSVIKEIIPSSIHEVPISIQRTGDIKTQ